MEMNFADLSVLIVIGLTVIRGFLRGFVVSVVRTFSLFISLFLAKLFHAQLANFIFSSFPVLRSTIYEGVKKFVMNSLPDGGGGGIDFSKLLEGVAPDIAKYIPKSANPSLNIQSNPQIDSAIDVLTSHISTFVINCIAFVVLFILISVGMEILIIGMRTFRKLPVIGMFDSFLGALLGLIQGWLILSVIFFLVINMNHAGIMKEFAMQIEHSMFASKLMSFSFVGEMIKRIIEISTWAFLHFDLQLIGEL